MSGQIQTIPRPTPREMQILRLRANGYMNKEIARKLGISVQTVKNLITVLHRRWDIAGDNAGKSSKAVMLALQHGILSLDDIQIRHVTVCDDVTSDIIIAPTRWGNGRAHDANGAKI